MGYKPGFLVSLKSGISIVTGGLGDSVGFGSTVWSSVG